MTRKHYIELADWARNSALSASQLDALIEIIGPMNKQFNKQKFVERAINE